MNGEKRLLFTDEPVEFEKWPVEVQHFTKSTVTNIILEESMECTPFYHEKPKDVNM